MDDMVRAALKKWPGVPACTGWLALDARGDWYMRDDRTQAAGAFPAAKGSRIEHRQLREFIERNYESTADGEWFFQNGPQRVYVELEAAPRVWRLRPRAGGAPEARSHAGGAAAVESAWLDDRDRLFLHTDAGFGIVHTQDMEAAADAVEAGLWTPRTLAFDAMPARFGFCLSPAKRWGAAPPRA
ncbi:MAG: DUF2946 family protein [Burkholderiaceae bacterium]